MLARFAAGAPVPVFAVVGAGARGAVDDLRAHDELVLVDTPGAANVLLIAGTVPDALAASVDLIHDGLSHPRVTVTWRAGEDEPSVAVAAVVRAHRELLAGERETEPPRLPDVDPAPWRGIGPYGQGGTGMTGGVPYGRPMAEVAPDRDGLRLDQLPVRIGPFFAPFPPGLVLEVKLQGDVMQEVTVGDNPFASTSGPPPSLRPFLEALAQPVPIATMELARARSHLRWAAAALRAHELPALTRRVLKLAQRIQPGDGREVEHLMTTLRRCRVVGWATAGVGALEAGDVAGLGLGPVARACGLLEDARAENPAYRSLGFEPVVHAGGDARARWRQRLAEAAQALDLAARAGGRHTEPTGLVESPRGQLDVESAPTARALSLVPALLAGLEWGDAITAIVSLDLDMHEATVR